MTATETLNTPSTTDSWDAEMAQLRNRYKAVREPILAAFLLLQQEPNITDDDAKARAAMRGVRITAASINGARNLMAKRETAVPSPATAAEPPQPRRPRPSDAAFDAEALIKQFASRLQQQGNAEIEQMRAAVRKAIAVLQTVLA